jgi:CheY-like chemotaxis protein
MSTQQLHILLAEDDESDRLNFREALAEAKIRTLVNTVNDGVELMQYLGDVNSRLPDLLFLDLNLPRKNGLECLKEIKGVERLKDISIAIYSTSSSETDIEETFRSGANVYIKKPNDFGLLKEVLNRVVRDAKRYQDPPFNKAYFLLRV